MRFPAEHDAAEPGSQSSFVVTHTSCSKGEQRDSVSTGPRAKSAGIQVLLHTPDARRIPRALRFPGRNCLNVCFVVDERTPRCVKRLPIGRNHDQHIRRNPGSRLGVLRTKLRMAEDRRSGRLEAASNQDCRCGRNHPSEKASPATRHILLLQPVLQTLAEAQWHFEHPFISVQLNDVTRAVKHSGAAPAAADVLFHGKPQIRFDPTIKVVRNLAPDFFAVDYHGLVPFSNDNLVLQLPPSPGDNRSRNISRARSKRVLTDALEIPSALAVSSILRCCMSRRTKTSRYFSPSEANASASFWRTSFRSRLSDGISRQSAKSRGT